MKRMKRGSGRLLSEAALAAMLASTVLNLEARAQSLEGFQVSLEPIMGFERFGRAFPSEHSVQRLVWGGGAAMMFGPVGIEGSYFRAIDRETFSDPDASVRDTTSNFRLGGRSRVPFGGGVSFLARVGAQIHENLHEEISGSVSVTTEEPTAYGAYAGFGVRLQLLPYLALPLDVTGSLYGFPFFGNSELHVHSGLALIF